MTTRDGRLIAPIYILCHPWVSTDVFQLEKEFRMIKSKMRSESKPKKKKTRRKTLLNE